MKLSVTCVPGLVRFTLCCVLIGAWLSGVQADNIRVLIVDGRNNHNWQVTTDSIRATLKATGRFDVDVATAPDSLVPSSLRAPRDASPSVGKRFSRARNQYQESLSPLKQSAQVEWEAWRPQFQDYDCVLLNYNGPLWSEQVREDFIAYVREGGGVFLVHAANNAFPNWQAFNDLIGIGWRKAPFGKAIKYAPELGEPIVSSNASSSGHGAKHPFAVTIRETGHPVMRGLPTTWMHARDELYHHMRGPAKNLTVLSSAWSDPKERGTGEHEPITWEVRYGKGRAIVTSMGHFYRGERQWDALYCVGFQTIVARSCEYLATGEVTLPVPNDFPGTSTPSIRRPSEMDWGPGKSSAEETALGAAQRKKRANPYSTLSPGEELTTFDLAPGYVAELVASEPLVEEPVLTVWDGNGVMYVAEMRSYMQDEHGTGTKELRNGRIKRLEDTTGDGYMDRVTTFVDGLNLPRMVLPLDDWIAVRESDTMDVIAYRDSDGDGIADQQKPLFTYGPRGRNSPKKSVEHQDSGLMWNLDNWIYITYNMERYRFTDGNWKAQAQPGHWTQWGLTHDDIGRLYWIHNSGPLVGVQLHPKYWYTVRRLAKRSINGLPVTLGDPYEPDFMKVKSLCLLNDRGGTAPEIRAFTSACGQTVFRGDKLPYEDRGRYFFVDPTIHVVRRANVENQSGKIMLTKAEPGDEEFLRSSDINCRFVNTASGPDGALYVTDMYRGIIQDAPWMNPKAREFTRDSGLANNRLKGRIWRIRHKDFEPGPRPRMLDDPTIALVRHFYHENGWWRDTAQRLILLRPDRESAIPVLEATARFGRDSLARLHALWTLEGMGKVSDSLLRNTLTDEDPVLRRAAIQVAEDQLSKFLPELAAMVTDEDPTVIKQLILTLGTSDEDLAESAIQQAAKQHLDDRGVMLATTVSLWGKKHVSLAQGIQNGSAFSNEDEESVSVIAADWRASLGNWDRGLEFPKDMAYVTRRKITAGETQYYQYCVTCHGSDGQGMKVPGSELALAPPLAGSRRVTGDAEKLLPIFFNGLTGPIEGQEYPLGFMASAKALGITRDDRLAEIISFIRFAWGNQAEAVSKEEVTESRKRSASRTNTWTEAELNRLGTE